METSLLPQSTEPAQIIIICVFLMLFMGMVLLLFFHFSKKKIIQNELEKKQIELEYQRDLLRVAIEVQDKERRRIAQDLHDDISSKLNVVALNSHLLMTPDITPEELQEISQNINTMVTSAIDNSRKISHDLLPTVLDKFGLDAGIKELCFELNSSKQVKVEYTCSATFDNLDKQQQLHIFRIMQELMNNSVRHGKAGTITVAFTTGKEGIACIYRDNGKGFDVQKIKLAKGIGMKSIESRIIFLNGSMSVSSAPDKGLEVILNF